MKVADVIELLETIAPSELAEEWDNVGLQAGSRNQDVTKILVALDVTADVVEEAIKKKANLIISHHPVIFGKGLSAVTDDTPHGALLKTLIEKGISLFVMHTNLDIARNGVNTQLARLLNLENCRPLREEKKEELRKLAVFVPEGHVEKVRKAICSAGAGNIGRYSNCTFRTQGTGTFKGDKTTDPFIGKAGKLEEAAEYRLETIYRAIDEKEIVAALIKAHPYEEVAYDLYPLENSGAIYGIGRIGDLPEKQLGYEFLQDVKKALDISVLSVCGNLARHIQRIAVCGGSGAEFIKDARRANCDVYITAELKHHHGLYDSDGMILVDASHYSMEKVILPVLVEQLGALIDGVDVFASQTGKDPFVFV